MYICGLTTRLVPFIIKLTNSQEVPYDRLRRLHSAERAAARLAGAGILCVYSLWNEHVHESRMGRRARIAGAVSALRIRRAAMGARSSIRGHARNHSHRKAPRRLLPLAERVHGAFRKAFSLEARRGARGCRRLPRGGAALRRLPLALGPARAELRPRPRIRRLFRASAHGAGDRR